MTSPARLLSAGMPAAQALQIGMDSSAGLLTATGSTIAGALTLAGDFSLFGTVASGTGAQLPAAEGQPIQAIYNGGSNALLVYPQAGEIINAGSVGVAYSVAAGKSCIFVPGKDNAVTPPIGAWIANQSA
jgi:hypothetical protein